MCIRDSVVTGISNGKALFSFTQIATGCVSSQTLEIVVLPKPDVMITGLSVICAGDQTFLSPTTGCLLYTSRCV